MIAPATPPPLRAEWERDARAALAAVHDERTRRKGSVAFEAMLVHLPPPVQGANARALRDAASRELAIPGKYQLGAVAPPQKSWLQRAWEWLVQKLDDLLHPVLSRLRLGPNGARGVGFAVILFALFVVAAILARVLRLVGFVREERSTYVTPLEAQRNAHALMLQASGLAAEGRYSDAVRVLFRAGVTLLDLRGAITDDAAATVNELQRELQERSQAAGPPFATMAEVFTHAAYAQRSMSVEDWTRARRAYDALNATVVS